MLSPRSISVVVSFVTMISASAAWSDSGRQPELTVTGSGEVRTVPDRVTIRFGIESRANALADAYQENEQRVSRIVERLGELEIEQKNIRTDVLKIVPLPPRPQPMFKGQQAAKVQTRQELPQTDPFGGEDPFGGAKRQDAEPQAGGYSVQRTMQVVIHRLDQFDEVYRSLIERGITKLDSIRFGSSKIDDLRKQARVAAMRSAREKAETLAGELGLTPVGVRSINETRSGSSPFDDLFGDASPGDDPFARAPAAAPTLFAGEMVISEHVHVVFLLDRAEIGAAANEAEEDGR